MKILAIASFVESLRTFRGALLDALVTEGLSVCAAAPQVEDNQELEDYFNARGIQLHRIPLQRTGLNPVRDISTCFALYSLMRREQPDVMLGYTVKPVIYGVLAAWLAGVPHRFALITGLGYAFTNGRNGLVIYIVRLLYRFALARAEKVFFQNPDDEALFRDLGILPASVPSVVVNGSGIDLAQFSPAPLPEKLVFLLVARLLGDKGVREYVAAARQVKAKFPGAIFRLVGWIDENPDAIRQEELDAWVDEGVVEYLGRLADVRPAIAGSMVYVLPSYREGTPRTVLEAMAMGRAVITTDAPGCRETVRNGFNGFLVPVRDPQALAEAMLHFAEEPGLATRMGCCAREIAEERYDVHRVNEVMLREMGIIE